MVWFHLHLQEWPKHTQSVCGSALLQEGEPYQRPLWWCQWAGPSPSYCTPAWARVTDHSAFTGEEMRSPKARDFLEKIVNSVLARLVWALGAKYSIIRGKAVGIRQQTSGIWPDNVEMPLRTKAQLRVSRAERGGSEVLLVWVPCPLPSLGSHKLARCNSLPDGLAPAGVCLYIRVLTGGCGACSICDLRCWECGLEGNRAT